ncbi:hypothetical protein ACNF49_20715 [Actinomadura sp. ATCC 39365]
MLLIQRGGRSARSRPARWAAAKSAISRSSSSSERRSSSGCTAIA